MAEPHVPFALKLPVDLDQQIRDEAQQTGKSIQSTIIACLRFAYAKRDTLEERS